MDFIVKELSKIIDIKLDSFIKSQRKLNANNVRISALNTYIMGEIMKKVYINKSNISIKNREINYKYDIIEKIECGIELKGTEVKSIRDGMCNLKDCFALIKDGEIILKNMHISPYEHGNINNVNPTRYTN